MNRFISLIVLAMLGAFVAGLSPGCYSPSVGECQYRCSGVNRTCPDGMFCNSETFCVSEQGMGCEGPPPPDSSEPPDAGMPVDVGPPGDVISPNDGMMPTLDGLDVTGGPQPQGLLPVAGDSITTVRESTDDVRR